MTDNRMSGDAGLEPSGLTMNEAIELRTEVEYLRTKVHALDNALAEQARRQVSAEMDNSRRIDSDREKSLLLQLDAKDVEIVFPGFKKNPYKMKIPVSGRKAIYELCSRGFNPQQSTF